MTKTYSTTGQYELSGFCYDRVNDRIWAIDDGGQVIEFTSSGTFVAAYASVGFDSEAICTVDDRPDFLYILRESSGGGGQRGDIQEWSKSTHALVSSRTFAFPTDMPAGMGGSSEEGLTYINADANYHGRFIVMNQTDGDLYFLIPDFSNATLTYEGKVTLSLGSNDGSDINDLGDGTVIVNYDAQNLLFRIELYAGMVGQTIDTSSSHVIESWTVPSTNPPGDLEASVVMRKWVSLASGVAAEVNTLFLGQDDGNGGDAYIVKDFPILARVP